MARSTLTASATGYTATHWAVASSCPARLAGRWPLRSGSAGNGGRVHARDRTYQLRRASIWRGGQELLLGDQPVGSIRRASMWRGSAVAELPGMPPPIQVFVLCVVLAGWEAATVAAKSAICASRTAPCRCSPHRLPSPDRPAGEQLVAFLGRKP